MNLSTATPQPLNSKDVARKVAEARRNKQSISELEGVLGEKSVSSSNPVLARTKNESSTSNKILMGLGFLALAGGSFWLGNSDSGKAFVNRVTTDIKSYFDVDSMLEPSRETLLPDFPENFIPMRTLVIDLEDTLVHLEWDKKYGWRAVKRPGLDLFLRRMAATGYEIVLFSSGVFGNLAEIVAYMDPQQCIMHQLFRESTTYRDGQYLKDLSRLNRNLADVIIIDDNPESFRLQPENGIIIKPFKDIYDTEDQSLIELIPLLEELSDKSKVRDVRDELRKYRRTGKTVAEAFAEEKQHQAQVAAEQKKKGLGGVIRRVGGQPHAQVSDKLKQQV